MSRHSTDLGPSGTTRVTGFCWLAPVRALIGVVGVVGVVGVAFSPLLTGCSGESAGPATWSAARCVDLDGDGYGAGCGAGWDCDDADVLATDACYRCLDDAEGCPCDAEGAREACGIVENRSGDQVVCGFGERVCAEGEWAECIVNNSTTLTLPEEPTAGAQDLGTAAACANNPCSYGCQEFVDDPSGLAPGGGVQSSGGSLELTPGSAPAAPSFCFGGTQGTCAHSVCTAGAALQASCDVTAPPQGVKLELFSEGFANNLAGWTLDSEWGIGPTLASTGQSFGNPDPASDHSVTGDNGVAGVVLGGIASTSVHAARWLTSPAVDVSAASGTLTLSYARWFNFSGGTTSATLVDVWNGIKWVNVQNLTTAATDAAWTTVNVDVTAHKNAAFRVRFGYVVLKKVSSAKVSALNVDDVSLTVIGAPPLPSSSCVSTICAADAACCGSSWGAACVAKVATLCGMDCANVAGTCALCYRDAQDHDSDGYSYAQGDCLDCDPMVNPGAFDFPGNGDDEDCSGVADDEPSACDSGLSMTSKLGGDHAKAIGLCRTTTESALGKQRSWGVLAASLVQANGLSAPHLSSHGISKSFGSGNVPFEGQNMAVYSSGTARAIGDPGYVDPNGQFASFDHGTSCAFPPGFPKSGAGCPAAPAGSSANDSTGLWLKMRVPSNAKSMSYKFNYFSSEYPEWVCTAYNDSFVALLTSSYKPANPPANSGNISFDVSGNPITVNISFFTVVGGAKLAGTGFGGICAGQVCGGATDWLESTAPVVPGETITLQFATWDTGDHKWDSTVLIDDFRWSTNPATIQTFVPQPPSGPTYSTASFSRDYDVSDACPPGTGVTWGLWSWSATTPSDSQVRFFVQTAPTLAELPSAPLDALLFSNPPGPSSLTGTAVVAKAGSPDTQGGSALVEATLASAERVLGNPFLRVTSTLVPSSDGAQTPELSSWNQQFSCTPNE
jgi:hypothetical protein